MTGPSARARAAATFAMATLSIGGVTAATTTATAAATTFAAPIRAAAARHWSGTGNRRLGTIRLAKDSVVRWTSSAGSFSLTDRSGRLKIGGRAKSGAGFAVRRTYRAVRVRAKGRWTLTIAPLPAPRLR